MTKLIVNEHVYLSEFEPGDKPALLRYLNDYEIYRWTLRIPLPYTDYDAERWLGLTARTKEQLGGRPAHWAIRAADGQLIGTAGFEGLEPAAPYRVELGYLVARPFWGKGIATAAVARLCRHVFEDWRVGKIIAHVFEGNEGSVRVLEKNGFALEGRLRAHYKKDGKLIDCLLFGLLAP